MSGLVFSRFSLLVWQSWRTDLGGSSSCQPCWRRVTPNKKKMSKAWAGCVLLIKEKTFGAWPCTMLFAVSNQVFLIEFDHTVHIPKLWLGISIIFNLGKAAGFATYPARPGNLLVAVWSVILQILEVKCRAIFESAGHVCTMHWRLMH